MQEVHDPQSLLRWSLRANALFSTGSGLSFLLFASSVAAVAGIEDSRMVIGLGVNLLGFATFLAFVSSRPEIHLPTVWVIVLLDVAWVVATVPIVVADLLTRSGSWAAMGIADCVLILAGLQALGLRRIRRVPGGATA